MRKLSVPEANACRFLAQYGERGFCPPWDGSRDDERAVLEVLDSLVRKKRATKGGDDAGPVYRLTSEGYADAA